MEQCGDNEHRFLPLSAARVEAEEIVVRSPLALLEAPEPSLYAARGAHLAHRRRLGEPPTSARRVGSAAALGIT